MYNIRLFKNIPADLTSSTFNAVQWKRNVL